MRKQKYNAPEMEVTQLLKNGDVICTSVDVNYGGVITDPNDPDYNPDNFD